MSFFNSIQEALPVTDPVLVFALVMLIILVAPLVAQRIRLPGIIGLILAGILVGEHGANLLARDDTIVLLGTVGLLYIMFLAGLEIDLHQFFRHRNHSAVFGSLTFCIPQVMGTVMALWVLNFSWSASILLASMFASHTLVAYPIAAKLGITRNRAVTAAIGGTIITDTVALLVLAIVAASASGDLTWIFWPKLFLSLGVYVLAVMIFVPQVGRWYFKNHSDQGARDFIFVLVTGLLCAYFAVVAGVEAIIGAFLGGLVLNRMIPDQGPLMNRVHFVGDALFVPFFLISVGMLVNLKMLGAEWYVWLVAGAMVSTVIITKWLAAVTARRILGFSPSEGRVMFGLSVPQAAATLAAVFVGFRIELFDEAVLNGAILMILVTCIVGPWFVDRFGRSVALQEELAPLRPSEAPLRILIPLANPSSAPALMDLAFMIRRPDSPEPVYPLMVANEAGDVQAQVAAGERMLGYAVIYAAGAGVPVQPVTRVDTNIANGITRAVTELRASTVVIGWSGSPSRNRQALGIVLDQVLRDNATTVIICRLTAPLNTTQRVVLIAPRFAEREPGFGEAIRTIKLMTSRLGASLVVYATEGEIKHLDPRMKRIKPQVTTEFVAASWPNLPSQLDAAAKDDDLFVLLSTREGRLPWTPELSRLPRRLANQFPQNNLVLFFPSEESADSVWYGSPQSVAGSTLQTQAIPRLLEPNRTTLGMPSMPFEDALEYVISPHFKDDARGVAVSRIALEKNAREYSTEITPGAALLHAHVPHLDVPTFFLSTCEEGLEVPRVTKPVHLLLILLSPEQLPPEEHLRTLSNIARMMRSPDLVSKLRSIRSFDELNEALNGSTA